MFQRRLFLSVLIATTLVPTLALATPLGLNITKFDGRDSASILVSGQDYKGTGVGAEDDETEYGTYPYQIWDLEAFLLDGNILSMVGGFNFRKGVTHGGHNYASGDIFIDVDGNWAPAGAIPAGWASGTLYNSLGWDYAIRMNFDPNPNGNAHSYVVWKIDNSTQLQKVSDIPESNPWRVANQTGLTQVATGTLMFSSYLGGGFSDWSNDGNGTSAANHQHYSVTGFDLGFLGNEQDFTAKFDMECGNDNLLGQGTTEVPESSSLMLLGVGFCAFALRRNRTTLN